MNRPKLILKKLLAALLIPAMICGLFPFDGSMVEAAANRVTMASSVSIRENESKVVKPVGNGYTIESLTVSTSNKKVATASVEGLSVRIVGAKRGRAVITTNVKAKKGFTSKTFTIRTTARVTSNLPVAVVTNQTRLDKALKKITPCVVRIVSYDGRAKTFNIPAGKHSNMDLEIDAAGATVTNKGTFRTVTVINISGGKYTEGAKTNSLTVNTLGKSDIVVKKKAKIKTLATFYNPTLTVRSASVAMKASGRPEIRPDFTVNKADDEEMETRIILHEGASITRILGNMSTEGHRDAVAGKSEYTSMTSRAYDGADAQKWSRDHAGDWTVAGSSGVYYDAAGRAFTTSAGDWAQSGHLTISQGANTKISAVYVEQTAGVTLSVGRGASIGTIGSSGNAADSSGMALSVTVSGGTISNLIAGGNSSLTLSASDNAQVKNMGTLLTGETTATLTDSKVGRLDQLSESALGLAVTGTSQLDSVNATGSGTVSLELSGDSKTGTVNTARESKIELKASENADVAAVNVSGTGAEVAVTIEGTATVTSVNVEAPAATVSVALDDRATLTTLNVSKDASGRIGEAAESTKVDVRAQGNSTVDTVQTAAGEAEVKVTADGTSTVSELKVTGNATATLAGSSTNTTKIDITEATAQADVTVTKPSTEVAAGTNASEAAQIVTNETGTAIPVTVISEGEGDNSGTESGSETGDAGQSTTIPPQQDTGTSGGESSGGGYSGGGGYVPTPTPTPTPPPTPTPVTLTAGKVNYKGDCKQITVTADRAIVGDDALPLASTFKLDDVEMTATLENGVYTLTAATAIVEGNHTITVENSNDTVNACPFLFDPKPIIRRPELEAEICKIIGAPDDDGDVPEFSVLSYGNGINTLNNLGEIYSAITSSSLVNNFNTELYSGERTGLQGHFTITKVSNGETINSANDFKNALNSGNDGDRVRVSYTVNDDHLVSQPRQFIIKAVDPIPNNTVITGSIRALRPTDKLTNQGSDESPLRSLSDSYEVGDTLVFCSNFFPKNRQWRRTSQNDGNAGSEISGATSTSYVVQEGDRGSYIALKIDNITSGSGRSGTLVTKSLIS